MIKLINLYKTYTSQKTGQTDALQDINLQVRAGEIFGVIGPSGAGKSTLIRCVNLLERPTSGEVIVDGQNLIQISETDLRQARQKIGMIFQHFNLLSSRTAYKNIALPLELLGKRKQEINNIVLPLLELVGLQDKKNFYPSQLSGGQKQRVAIARALVTQPKVLLCDEATSALDPQTTHSILQLLKNINEQFNLTILLITHEMNVIKEICHRLAVLENGHIIEQAEVIKFFGQPETQLAKEFIRSSLKEHLPDNLKKRISANKTPNSTTLLQISFLGKSANESVISKVIQEFHIDLNILQANIEHIRDEIVGIMIVSIDCDEKTTQACMKFLEDKGLKVEIIGYVN